MSDNGFGGADKLQRFIQEQHSEAATKLTAAEAQKAAIIGLLGALGGMAVTDDSIEFSGSKIVLPEQYEGRIPQAIDYLDRYYKGQEKPYGFNKTFNYRPWDGAHAFQQVMKKLFGTTGIGKNVPASFFSPERPPQMLTIATGLGTTEQVPWGEVEFPPLNATFQIGFRIDPEKGRLFHLGVEAPKKYRKHIEGFYQQVERYLNEHSIYKGKAITGAEDPDYLDTSRVDPAKVVYSEEIMRLLDQNLWGRVKYADSLRDMGIPLKRAVLLEGPYGCIQGDAEMTVNRGGNGFKVSLKNLVKRFNGEDPRYSWDPSIPTYVQREMPDGTIRLGEIANAWYSGQKQTYTITTNSGRTLRATDEHPFLTERGWLRLDEMVVGDLVHVRGVQVSNVLYKATTETVVSVEPYGVEDTYDIEVVGDPHNFLANGFVVHNTGKSLAGMLTAQEAERSGWTYILCRPGTDDLFETLKTAQLYAPAVVWFEDIDVVASSGDPERISKLLDLLDGVQGKGVEVIAGFTTNFVEKLQKGVLRPGRIDSIIHIGELDAKGLRKLINQLIKPKFLGDIDYDLVQKAFGGFLPAFVTEAINGALAVSLTRNGGRKDGIKIDTDDLVDSALGLRRQLDLMNGATEGQNAPTMQTILEDTLVSTLNKTKQNVIDKDGDYGLFVEESREISD